MRIVVAMMFATIGASGCVNHINPYTPPQRKYVFLDEESGLENRSPGSIWSPHSMSNDAIADNRARRVGDTVTILVEESASATQDTSISTEKSAEREANILAFLGAMKKLRVENGFIEQFENGGVVDYDSLAKYEGTGSGSRNQQMTATVPAIVKKISPRGNLLFVEGHRALLVNNEEHHFYISGVIRKNDINNLNRISSTEMADAQIEFTGRGDMTDGTEKGWLTRTLDYIWPF